MTAVPADPTELPADRYAVVGHPVAHSLSPFIHAAFARQTGQRLVYGRLDCPPQPPGAFAGAVRAFAAAGGRGCNVTVPFKFLAPALAARVSARAALAQAANVLVLDGAGGWSADNSDGIGLVRDLQRGAGRTLAGARALLVGAGGAAAGVAGPLLQAGLAELVVVNRTPDRATALVGRHAPLAAACGARLRVAPLEDPGRGFDLVVNASASSLHGGAVPVPAHVLRPGALAVDLMYGAAAAPFLDWARAAGAEGRDGLGMLVEQAAEAFALWRGVRPDTAPVLAALRAPPAGPSAPQAAQAPPGDAA